MNQCHKSLCSGHHMHEKKMNEYVEEGFNVLMVLCM